jgi:hypothetical protein
MVVEGILDGGKDGEVLVTGVGMRCGGVDTDVDILCAGGRNRESEQDKNVRAKHVTRVDGVQGMGKRDCRMTSRCRSICSFYRLQLVLRC